jgi:hypothetical protein
LLNTSLVSIRQSQSGTPVFPLNDPHLPSLYHALPS